MAVLALPGRGAKVISRLGEADLHKLVLRHGRLYAYDAVPGARTWKVAFRP